MADKPNFKCYICGQSICNNDFIKNNVDLEFAPNSLLSMEKILYLHKDCKKPKRRDYETIYKFKW